MAKANGSALIDPSFRAQAIGFPDHVERALAEITTPKKAKAALDQAVALQAYAEQLKAGIEIERPIAIGVLKIKAKIGELSPPQKGGRGKTTAPAAGVFATHTIAAYRKLHEHKHRLDEYYDSFPDEVPSQAGFIHFARGGHIANNSGVPEWYTPTKFLFVAREVMGGIDLDPASSEQAQRNVRAERYFTLEDDGLSQPWWGRVWLNPPYTKAVVVQFAEKLLGHLEGETVTQAILLVNNATETKWFQDLVAVAAAICFPLGRIEYHDEFGDSMGQPLQGQAFLYFGDRHATFVKKFSQFGFCVVPK